MKGIHFIFHQRPAYAVDWESLVQSDNPDNQFILVTTKTCLEKLKPTDNQHFHAIIEVSEFAFEELAMKMRGHLSTNYNRGDHIRIAVLSEFTMSVAANIRDELRKEFNIIGPGNKIIRYFRDKIVMKTLLAQHGIRLPKYSRFDSSQFNDNTEAYLASLEAKLGYPMFAKPTDSAGSIGTALIKDRAALVTWCKQAAQEKQSYELDEFIDGTLYHCDSIIKDGRILTTLVNQYLHPNADARTGKLLASITLNEAATEYPLLKNFAESTLNHFPTLPDGFTHMEIFINQRDELIFLEVAARAPGAKAPENFKIRTGGLDMRWLHLRLNMGLPINDAIRHLKNADHWGPHAAFVQQVAPLDGGIVTRINQPSLRGGEYIAECVVAVGDEIKPGQSILDTICSWIFWNKNDTALREDFKELDEHPLAEVQPLPSNRNDSVEPSPSLAWRLLDRICQSILDFSRDTVEECPSYFPNCRVTTTSSTLFNPRPHEFSNTSELSSGAAPRI